MKAMRRESISPCSITLITASKDDFFFQGRNRRPPLDNVNALLSFVYTLLTHDMTAALEGGGARSGGRISASRPAGAAESGAGSAGGIAAGDRGPAGAVADQSAAGAGGRVSQDRERRGGDGRRDAERGAGGLSERASRKRFSTRSWGRRWRSGWCRISRRCCWRGSSGAIWTGIRVFCGSEARAAR